MIFDFNKFKDINIYALPKRNKSDFFLKSMKKLTDYHSKKCKEYNIILKSLGKKAKNFITIKDIPFLPTRLFKSFELKSIIEENIFKTLNSSGTTGQKTSRIVLDKFNASNQVKVLNKIVSDVLGKKRLPMLIIDSEDILKNKKKISARTAAVNGFSIFGYDHTFLLNSDMKINISRLTSFLEKHKNEKIFIFGFTFIIWNFFCEALKNQSIKLNLNNCILIHGGGWKKLHSKNINNQHLKTHLKSKFNLKKIFNYYGMVEQTGSIFLECDKCDYFVTSIFSDIIIRDTNLSVCANGQKGIVQLLSLLPSSYPGHSILTDDVGVIKGEDNCKCKKLGKYFKIMKRVDKSDLRGCSDTFNT